MDNGWEMIAHMKRGCGKTYQMIQAAKALNGTLICGDETEAKRVEKEHGVKTTVWNKNLRGFNGPFLVDPYAISRYASRMQSEVTALKAQLKTAREVLNDIAVIGEVMGPNQLEHVTVAKLEKIARVARQALKDLGGEG